jgi:putative membrane protein
LRTLLLRWAVTVIAVALLVWGLPQVGFDQPLLSYGGDWLTLAIFSAVLALLNTFVRPILVFLSLPLTCLTLGLFTLVINTIMFALASALTPGFEVANFWAAFVGALAVTVIGVVVNLVVGPER